MVEYNILELLETYAEGRLKEGAVIKAVEDGSSYTFKKGNLHHLTSAGYVTSPVEVTVELTELLFIVESKEYTPVGFMEAMRLLGENQPVYVEDGSAKRLILDIESLINRDEYSSISLYEAVFENVYFKEADKAVPKTETNKHKLTEADAYTILEAYHKLGRTVPDLAYMYDVTTRMIYYILDGTYWADVYNRYTAKNSK